MHKRRKVALVVAGIVAAVMGVFLTIGKMAGLVKEEEEAAAADSPDSNAEE